MTPFQLKDLRDFTVAVVHPPDSEGRALMEQLNRIGCRTEIIWPPSNNISPATDIVFAGVFFETHDALKRMIKKFRNPKPTIIAIVNYENPAMLQNVLEIEAFAVVSKPIREFGMLTNLVVARSVWLQHKLLIEKANKLEKRISTQKNIATAKQIIMEIQSVSEQEAYKILRSQAMSKRVAIEEMAIVYINANDLLSKRIEDV